MNDHDKEELAKRSGESDFRRPSRYVVPIICFNGQTGQFSRMDIGKDGTFEEQKELPIDNIECTFLKIRRSFQELRKEYVKFTNEHDKWSDPMVLFETTKGKKTTMIGKYGAGEYEKIRSEHPELKLHIILYTLIDNEIIKLSVKGSGLSNLFRYFKEDFLPEEHSFEYITKITVSEEKGQLGTYYSLNFARGDKLKEAEMNKVATKIKEVDDAIKAQAGFYETTSYPEEPEQDKVPDEAYEKDAGEVDSRKDEIPTIESE